MFDREMRYRLVSRRWLEEYDLGNRDIIGKSHYEIFPDIPQRWQEIHQRCLQGAVESCEEDPFVRADGRQEWIRWKINPWKGDRGEISGIIMDTNVITERKQAKEELQRLNEELSRSNRDLEMFAYVASHDLQEPLRAVNSYTQLLARKYQSHLDAKADKYIGYIVEGATRMQQLINDLLEFSRVGTRGKELVPTNCEVILKQVLANLRVAIAESHATITHTPLPTVLGDEIQLIQLLQNLIGNAIKFRREEPPHIHISAARQEKEWLFSVRDNGIGLEPEYFDRIFTIFQRLHSRSEYSGTGIGLAVCKKIVERHGGRIWVESELGVGTTFYFTLNEEFCDRERSCQTC
jgi:PAS domain S-box-containing protein